MHCILIPPLAGGMILGNADARAYSPGGAMPGLEGANQRMNSVHATMKSAKPGARAGHVPGASAPKRSTTTTTALAAMLSIMSRNAISRKIFCVTEASCGPIRAVPPLFRQD